MGEIRGYYPQIIALAAQARIVPQKKVAGPVPRAGISRLCPPKLLLVLPQKWVKFLSETKKAVQIEWTPCSSLRFFDEELLLCFYFCL